MCTILLSYALPGSIHAQDEGRANRGVLEAVDIITKLPSIFWDWVNEFDKVAEKEKRKELIRKVDALRKDLYRLELDKRFLLESIPDKAPDIALIRQNIHDLDTTLQNLRHTLRDIGADVRATEGQKVEDLIRNSLSTRTKGLSEIEAAVQNPNYDATTIREALLRGIAAVNAAQVAVTAFYNRISKEA
jgi:DNA repair exonuclease SbcCD ATPase subunit